MKLKKKEENDFVVQVDFPPFQMTLSDQWNQGPLDINCKNMLIFQKQVIC